MIQFRSLLPLFVPAPTLGALLSWYHWFLSLLSAIRYGFPSRRLSVIGVTGTDGKTTTVHLLHGMLVAAGRRVGSVSSLRFKILEREEQNFLKMTMPGRFRLQRFLAECRDAGCDTAIIEVTSQGIAQHRHRFIRFDAAVLTNVSPEHVESHGGFEAYRAAKAELFRLLPPTGYAVLNLEDASQELFARATRARAVRYSRSVIDGVGAGHPVRNAVVGSDRIEFDIGSVSVEVALGGAFNLMNTLAAAAAAISLGVSPSAIAAALRDFPGMAGRLEYVVREPFSVVVDYANTPQAYEAVYRTLAERHATLICVFGAPGGGRDKWKRPELGKIAARHCKAIFLTADDPDDEDPATIAAEIRAGVPPEARVYVREVLDRRQAIRDALAAAASGDTVVITGMGAQPWLIDRGGKKIPWDDRAVVREEFALLRKPASRS